MTSLSCGAIFVKYLLCLFNFIFFVAGGVILALSIWLAVDNTSLLLVTRLTDNPGLETYSSPSILEHGAYLLIAAGGLVFLLGFLGCCGAATESRSLLSTYGLLVVVLFILQVTGGIMAAVYRVQAEEELEDILKLSLHKYYSTEARPNAVTLAWDGIMQELECCGVNNYTDFEKSAMWQTNKSDSQVIPAACCYFSTDLILSDDPLVDADLQDNFLQASKLQGDDPFPDSGNKQKPRQRVRNRQRNQRQKFLPECVTNPNLRNSNFLTGCYGRMRGWVRNNSNIFTFSVIALAIAQLLAILLAFSLCAAVSGRSDK